MSEDTCGAETADGSPCEHPAQENGRCWIPAHNPGDDGDFGRPSKYTEDRAHKAIDAAREGMSKAGCARAAGVAKQTFQQWLTADHTVDGEDFTDAFMRARHAGEKRLVTGPLVDHPDSEHRETIDGQHARFLLSTSFDYIKTERREVDGELDLSDVVVDFEGTDT